MSHYYDADGIIYPTQLDAIASNKECRFYFHDDEFSMVDWSVEPTETLDILYKERAQYIRDTNEYLILCYSGGADSTSALESFYYNGIHIDEIVMVGAFSQDSHKGSDDNHNGDIYLNSFPTLSGFNLPNTKITLLDYTKWFNDPNNFSLIKMYGNEWTKHIGSYKSVHNLFWYDLKKFVGNNKQTAYIMGSDKTSIADFATGFDHQIGVFFNDLPFTDYGNNYEDENFRRVNFHTDPHYTSTRLMRKQAHIMYTIYLMYREKYGVYNSFWRDKDKIYKRVVYNLKNPLAFESKKSVLSSVSARDMFMFDNKNSEMYSMFSEGLNTIRRYGSVGKKYFFNSRPYFLEQLNGVYNG
ncbi:hypothetical protein UFOVP132_86 [uncultured Caudovirales phage]|uniref:Uncharacterized protein n=1 Tax=uncultured Caudovirales phage TaxID=2100421 RepID=A0A6J5LA19_9CAUD|nr:hypothetical protein UFOVP132_86 [uncultured Caudovirales phage]